MDRFQSIEAYHGSRSDQERYSDSRLTHSELLYNLLQHHTKCSGHSFYEVGKIHRTFERDGSDLFLRETFEPTIASLTAMVLITSTAINLTCACLGLCNFKGDAYDPLMFDCLTVVLHSLIFFVLAPGKFQPSKSILMSSWIAFGPGCLPPSIHAVFTRSSFGGASIVL